MTTQEDSKLSGYLLLLLAQCMVGVSIVTAKSLVKHLSPITILNARFIIATALLLFFHFIFSKKKIRVLGELNRKDWVSILAQAICAGALFNILLLAGLQHASASIAGIITSALPALVVILSVIFIKERLTLSTFLCVGFAVIGLIIVNAHNLDFGEGNQLLGAIIILLALLPEAAYYVLAKIHNNKLPVLLISALMNGINIPIFLLLSLADHDVLPRNISSEQLTLLVITGVSSALFYVFWFLGCKKVNGTLAGLSTAFMPIATLVIAWIFLGETIASSQAIGMMLVIASIMFNARKRKKHKNKVRMNY